MEKLRSPEDGEQRATARDVLATETAWLEQAWLRTPGGSQQVNPTTTPAIVSPRDSSQRRLGEIQKETLSKTVRSSDRLWSALTERDLAIWGEGACVENRIARTPRTSMGATQKLMGGPNVDLVLLCACAYAQ